MTVLNKLATSLNERSEVPNQLLAQAIERTSDKPAVRELVENLSNKNKAIQSDCIKVLYEIGEREPGLIAGYFREFVQLLESKNNRLVWGAMTALDAIALEEPDAVYEALEQIMAAADSGSVIARDHAVGVLTKLGTIKRYARKCLQLLLEQLRACPDNQLPMYAEKSLAVVTEKNRAVLQGVLTDRLDRLPKESQKKRVQKVLKRMTAKSS